MKRLLSLLALTALALCGCDRWAVRTESSLATSGLLQRHTELAYVGDTKDDPSKLDLFVLPDGVRAQRDGDRIVVDLVAEEGPLEVLALRNERETMPRATVSWSRLDCAVFELYRYQEDLIDSADEGDFHTAAAPFYKRLRALILGIAETASNGQHDLTPLEIWLDGVGKELILDCLELHYKHKDGRGVAARLRRDGIEVGDDWDSGKIWEAIVRTRLDELVPPKGRAAGLDPEALLGEPLEALTKAVAEDLYGSTDQAAVALYGELYRAIGDLGAYDIEFELRLTMPGRIVRSNGLIESPYRAYWRFKAQDAAFSGKQLTADSLVEHPELLAALAPGLRRLEARMIDDLVAFFSGEPLTEDEAASLRKAIAQIGPAGELPDDLDSGIASRIGSLRARLLPKAKE